MTYDDAPDSASVEVDEALLGWKYEEDDGELEYHFDLGPMDATTEVIVLADNGQVCTDLSLLSDGIKLQTRSIGRSEPAQLGKTIMVCMSEVSGDTVVEVESQCKLPLQLIDWGKDKRHVRRVMQELRALQLPQAS